MRNSADPFRMEVVMGLYFCIIYYISYAEVLNCGHKTLFNVFLLENDRVEMLPYTFLQYLLQTNKIYAKNTR